MHEIINKILEISQRGRSCVVATVVASSGSSPRKIGARMLVCEDATIFGTVGGGGLEKLAIGDARVALKKKTSFLKSYSLKKRAGLGVAVARSAFTMMSSLRAGILSLQEAAISG